MEKQLTIFDYEENKPKMTVKEVSDSLHVTDRTIRNYVSKLFPEAMINGKTTLLSEIQVTKIKLESQFRCNGSNGYLSWIDNSFRPLLNTARMRANNSGVENGLVT